jgi:hypothetical protein
MNLVITKVHKKHTFLISKAEKLITEPNMIRSEVLVGATLNHFNQSSNHKISLNNNNKQALPH